MDDDASNTYSYIKLYSDIAAAQTFIIEHILYLPLEYPFGLNIVGYI